MKRTYLYTFMIVLASLNYNSFGQATNLLRENGNVGIGTLNPTEKLSVEGNVIWDGYNSGNSRAVKIGYSGGNYGGIGYNIDFTGSTGIFNRPFADLSSYLEFWHGGFKFFGVGNHNAAQSVNLNGTANNLNLFATITNTGNFGIGTNNPVAKLSVSNNGAEGLEIVPGSSLNSTRIYAYNRSNASYNDLIFNTANVDFRGEADASRFYIQNSSGNVGIGTVNPTHKFTIDGDIKLNGQSKGLFIEYATLSETFSGASTILGNNVKAGVGYNTVKRFFSPADPGSYIALNYLNGITFHTGVTSALDAEVSSSDNEAVRITQSGNVGIGTTDPKDYKLAVNGKIRAQEIKVETSHWPDYVFAKTYQLPTLQETEKHIKDKGHLPGIPSAEEVKANGIDLGEMNAKLLQKIEELTLHLIKENKENENNQERLKEQDLRLTEQSNKLKQQEERMLLLMKRLDQLESKK